MEIKQFFLIWEKRVLNQKLKIRQRNYIRLTRKSKEETDLIKNNNVGRVQGFKPGAKVDLMHSVKPRQYR